MPDVHGRCAPGFEPLRGALSDILAAGAEVGVALAIYVDKQAVVDLWGGHADAAKTRPWTADTIVDLYSIGKAVSAVCALRLVDAGALDLDAPVSRYWPEFAQAGKAKLPVRFLLTHQAGLPAVGPALPAGAALQWNVITEALAAQAPWWPPGERHGYHVNTQGFLLGEVIRRITGKTIGAYLRDEIAGPASIDFFWGVGPELDGRCADMVAPPPSPEGDELRRRLSVDPATLSGLALMRVNAYRNPPEVSGTGVANSRRWRAAEVPSTNGHGNARAVARLYAALAGDGTLDGVRILSREIIAMAIEEQVYADDVVLQRPTRFGLGFQLTQSERRLGPSPRAFGHFGYGGSLGFADPDAGLAFGYLMNRPGERWNNPRTERLLDALYQCL